MLFLYYCNTVGWTRNHFHLLITKGPTGHLQCNPDGIEA